MEFPKKFNVLVTGTPGSGKTSLCQMLQDELGLIHIEIGKIVKEQQFYSEFDPSFDSYLIEQEDEDRLLDYLEPVMVKGGCCVDYHSSEFFPRRWFGMVLVLRANTSKIYDRLTARGYSDAKREENMDAEISGVCEDEARRAYHESVLVVQQSNELTDMLSIVELVRKWKNEWTPEKQEFATLADLPEDDEDYNYENDGQNGDGNNNNNGNDEDYFDGNGDPNHEKLRVRLEQQQQAMSSNNNNSQENNNNAEAAKEQFMQQMQQQQQMQKKPGSC